ncbi:MAG: carbohydrate ABC transporter permease [Pseudomonadota bacterium]|nr:carbohydrate ABC transporter permease [Pseudomonadota bacterium]
MRKSRRSRLLRATLLVLLAAFALFPLLWMVSVSLMAPGEARQFPPPLLPDSPGFSAYRALFETTGIARYFLNSMFIASLGTLLSLMFNATAGYAFAKLRFKGRDRIFQLLLAALVIPAQVTMLPLFLMLKEIGLINTFAGVLIPVATSIFGIFLVRQYALSIPDELLEAARIDGASEGRIFLQIVVPVLTPILVTLALFTFLGTWSDFMWPLIILTDQEKYTLPVAIAALSREHVQDNEMMMAGAVLTVLPVLLLFLVLQRYYMQGLLAGSVKG